MLAASINIAERTKPLLASPITGRQIGSDPEGSAIMDSNRFDALSRAFADRTSRRTALRRFGLVGLGSAALASAGPTDSAMAADTAVCVLALTAPVATVPDKGTSYNGDLSLTIGSTGAIDEASLKLANGKTHNAVGQATGRTLNLRIDLGGGKNVDAERDRCAGPNPLPWCDRWDLRRSGHRRPRHVARRQKNGGGRRTGDRDVGERRRKHRWKQRGDRQRQRLRKRKCEQ